VRNATSSAGQQLSSQSKPGEGYPFIEVERAERRNVKRACALLEISRAAFYAWLRHVSSRRQRRDEQLLDKIETVHEDSKGTYGSPRVHAELKARGEVCGENRIARLMQANGIVGRTRRRFRKTTIPDPEGAAVVDLVKRAFGPGTVEVDRLWCSDISFTRTWEGWMYLATVIDAASRRVVGWAMAEHMRAELACDALKMAIQNRRPSPGLIFHSDRGSQYVSRRRTSWLRLRRAFICKCRRMSRSIVSIDSTAMQRQPLQHFGRVAVGRKHWIEDLYDRSLRQSRS
jgi:putative transposase